MGLHAPGQVHIQVPRASVTSARFSATTGRRFSSCGPRVARVCFITWELGQLRNAGQVAWPQTRVAGRLESRLSRRHSTHVR